MANAGAAPLISPWRRTIHTTATTLMRVPHLVSAVTVLLVAWTALWVGEMWAVSLERRFAHALAPQQFQQKDRGTALQRAAFAQPDLLPVYGSSELQTLDNPYHASNLFSEYPTGFTVFPIGDIGSTTASTGWKPDAR